MYLQSSRGEAVFTVVNLAFLIALSLTFVIPFLSIISTSLIGIEEWARRGAFILFPQHIEFGAYQILFTGGSRLATGFFYSLARVLIGTALNLLFTATLAYVLARRGLPGRVGMTLFVFVTMIISGGLIPTFFLIDRMGLTNPDRPVPARAEPEDGDDRGHRHPHPVRLPLHPALLRQGRHDRQHQGVVVRLAC